RGSHGSAHVSRGNRFPLAIRRADIEGHQHGQTASGNTGRSRGKGEGGFVATGAGNGSRASGDGNAVAAYGGRYSAIDSQERHLRVDPRRWRGDGQHQEFQPEG